eukprot:TRINITY_DN5876_c0_g1_i2.p1 TRINITY_DN5876_c0_g1~~TRINITY_DN5876_c0_g1_i2.p1  ORF type:complete len:146 (-),score=9.28 TRINITY_DN5876_c0_g1_i2:33-470(-)
MGCMGSREHYDAVGDHHTHVHTRFHKIADKFQTLEEVQNGLRESGLESSNLILGVDYTKSNTWNGKRTFGGKCLHNLDTNLMNPYQEVIYIIGRTLAVFDDDNLIPAYGKQKLLRRYLNQVIYSQQQHNTTIVFKIVLLHLLCPN